MRKKVKNRGPTGSSHLRKRGERVSVSEWERESKEKIRGEERE